MIYENLKQKLQIALDREGTHELEDIKRLIYEGKAQLFQNKKALFITEILNFPKKKVLNAWLTAGSMDGVHELTPIIEEFGRMKGCTEIQMTGRKGWMRILKNAEFKNIVLKRSL